MRRMTAEPFSVCILVPDIQDKIVDKDEIKDITYGPSISREWFQETNIEYPEWSTREGFKLNNHKWVKQFVEALKEENKLNKKADLESDEVIETNLQKDDEIDETNFESDNTTIESDINIEDLPTVIWNEEEYRVLFNDDGTAEILNNFGNHVTTLEDTSTITQVDEKLGEQIIVNDDNENTDEQEDEELIKNGKKEQLKQTIKRANENLEKLNSQKQQYAHIDHFDELIDKYNGVLNDLNHMLKSIEETEKKIQQDNSMDITQRIDEYYSSVLLNEDDTTIFQSNICPNCNNESLELIEQGEDYWEVRCNECNSLFTIDTHTGEIFFNKEESNNEEDA